MKMKKNRFMKRSGPFLSVSNTFQQRSVFGVTTLLLWSIDGGERLLFLVLVMVDLLAVIVDTFFYRDYPNDTSLDKCVKF